MYDDFEFETKAWEEETAGPGILADLLDAAADAARSEWESKFVSSVSEQFQRRGSLSDKQVAVLKRIVNPTERQRQAQRPTGIDLSSVPSGLYAVPGGNTRLKVRIDNVKDGKWAGWVFVKDGAEYGHGKRYGSQRPGQLYAGDIEDELRVIAANPFEASKAYGRLVGVCGVCGRHLENAESLAAGIGPICATRFGGEL